MKHNKLNKNSNYECIKAFRSDYESIEICVLKTEIERVIKDKNARIIDKNTDRKYDLVHMPWSTRVKPVFVAIPVVEKNRDDLTLGEAISLIPHDSFIIFDDKNKLSSIISVAELPMYVTLISDCFPDDRVFRISDVASMTLEGHAVPVSYLTIKNYKNDTCTYCGDKAEFTIICCLDKEAIA